MDISKNVNSNDPWDVAEKEQPRGFEFYGQVHADANFIFFQKLSFALFQYLNRKSVGMKA